MLPCAALCCRVCPPAAPAHLPHLPTTHPLPLLPSPALAGTTETASEQKKGYKLPRHIMANGDLARLINSDEIQSVVKPQVRSSRRGCQQARAG